MRVAASVASTSGVCSSNEPALGNASHRVSAHDEQTMGSSRGESDDQAFLTRGPERRGENCRNSIVLDVNPIVRHQP